MRTIGLIPAWAGKTQARFPDGRRYGAHPRVGGENQFVAALVTIAAGSSPRGRGKQVCRLTESAGIGLIPAWAGKTTVYAWYVFTDRAHPRVGGENSLSVAIVLRASGSSPRGRGKLANVSCCENGPGLIPAWAGKTVRPLPRACR